MTPTREKLKAVLAAVVIAFFLGRSLWEAAGLEWRRLESGAWSERFAAAARSEDEIRKEELGSLAPWVEVIRKEVPENGLVAFQPPPRFDRDLSQTLLALRVLCYPRRIRPAFEVTAWVQEDWTRLDDRIFGLSIGDAEPPPYAEYWQEVAAGADFRLRRWAGKPR